MRQLLRPFLLFCGFISLSLGAIGVFLPLLPTTPFLLMALFFFARSSEDWQQWLLQHRTLGKFISDWQRDGVIPLYAKIVASGSMIAGAGMLIWRYQVGLVSVAVICIMIVVATFIWSRPSYKE